MQQHEIVAHYGAKLFQAAQSDETLANAVILIHNRQYRQGERNLARYTASIQPLYPDVDYLDRRGVDLVALAWAIENSLDLELFGKVMDYKAWDVECFNRFNRAQIRCAVLNDAMRRFLDHPSNW